MSPSRIDELRRRVQSDPASIAFAQLAEEYRRSGQTDEAVRVCREGLTRHPGYLSARVTLGRALLDLGQLADARGEFEFVVTEAPENLAAVRGLAEIFQRDGSLAEALNYYRRALALARHDPELEEIVQQLSRQVGVATAGDSNGLSFEEAHRELLSAAERVPAAAPLPAPKPLAAKAAAGSTAPFDFDRLVAALGTPAAPVLVEAVVQGRAGFVAADLPEPAAEPANPFAALEAELRAHDAAATGSPVDSTSSAHAAPADGLSDDETFDLAALPTPPAATATPSQEPESPQPVEGLATVIPASSPTSVDPPRGPQADTLMPAAASAGLLDPEDPAATPSAEPAAVAANTSRGGESREERTAPAEDVLGDLESWLETLHDRSNG